ncbi:MAG: sugar phosphate isomerase/epimerase [Clostridia bacterium]|nr:sugar phosphate isomerase/epimerase [Clostridia bacterium]
MFIPGLVSVTFRKHTRREIAEAMQKAGLSAIEWGGDVHVVPMDGEAVTDALAVCGEFGCRTASYGSYYRCTADDAFASSVVDTAVHLGTKHIRVWAGTKGSAAADSTDRAETVRNLKKICRSAAVHGITVSPEFHQGTLTDHYESAVRLMEETEEENLRLYWQPNQFMDDAYNLAAVRAVLPYVSNVHVFTWDAKTRYPLADGEKKWREYLDILAGSGRDHHLLMEFVRDDSMDQFFRDAETLLSWIGR